MVQGTSAGEEQHLLQNHLFDSQGCWINAVGMKYITDPTHPEWWHDSLDKCDEEGIIQT